ncbi:MULTISPECIES: hypothetical protein [unclassified Arthrobacter]|uniref:hypothetical protein n=1 Tax=unclassified Arthrobacter TaxID=235627 RepID=UPI002DF899F7|nr:MULTISPECIES: hypothetical protein [unclassified Arthrobacter]MEC5191899.1 putative NAD-dependent protein-ADP-ribosyltransferase YbiA (DUF1768 family) [Arthrobacter sp. MP_M4]MEC5202404.1 putative NAD-dependent protein-ADP-ribosyltransferase YbiA (DUF1768 family) [Arthrobacter sp. MP_M7]
MDFAWTVPVALIISGTTYATYSQYFKHKERLAVSDTRSSADPGIQRQDVDTITQSTANR